MEKELFKTEGSQNCQEELEKLANRSVILFFLTIVACIAACVLHRFGMGRSALIGFVILIACLAAYLVSSMMKFFTLESQQQSSLRITSHRVSGIPVLFDGRKAMEAELSEITGIERVDDSRLRIHTLQESYTFFIEETEEVCRILNSVVNKA